jgi:hypothetical protein
MRMMQELRDSTREAARRAEVGMGKAERQGQEKGKKKGKH